MSSVTAEVQQLIREAGRLPQGTARIAVLDDAVARADLAGDPDLGFAARTALAEAAAFGGAPERLITSFAWLLARMDDRPGHFDERNTLWRYKWAASRLPEFETIPLAQIAAAIDDLEDRARRYGAGPRTAAKLRCMAAAQMGDLDGVARWLPVWRRGERDQLSDCRACDANETVEMLLFLGDADAALAEAQPILAGRLGCREVPHRTYAMLLRPLLTRGEADLAGQYQRRGYDLIRGNRELLTSAGEHVAYLSLVGNLTRAKVLLERHLPWALESRGGLRQLLFLLDARLFLGLSELTSGGELRVPAALVGADSGPTPLGDVIRALDLVIDRQAAAFDSRNGNVFYAGRRALVDRVIEGAADRS